MPVFHLAGEVTWEQIFGIFAALSMAGAVVAGFVAWLWKIVSNVRLSYQKDIAARASEIRALESDLRDYKQHVAETYASRSGVSQQISRLETAVEGIAEKVEASSNRITERIDRLLENQAHHTASPRRRTP